jgi:hypothetical protein
MARPNQRLQRAFPRAAFPSPIFLHPGGRGRILTAPLSTFTRISLTDALFEWALAERSKWERFNPALAHRIAQGQALDRADKRSAVDAFAKIAQRAPEVPFFSGLDAAWYETSFPIATLGDVRLHLSWAVHYWSRRNVARPWPLTVSEFARRDDLPPEFNPDGHPHPLQGSRPIYVATNERGPWHIAEGSHRTHTIWTAHKQGHAEFQGSVRAIVGVHRNMSQWGSFVPD